MKEIDRALDTYPAWVQMYNMKANAMLGSEDLVLTV